MDEETMKFAALLGILGLLGSAIVSIVSVTMYLDALEAPIGIGYAYEGLDYGIGISWMIGMFLFAIALGGLGEKFKEFPVSIPKLAFIVAIVGAIAVTLLWVDGDYEATNLVAISGGHAGSFGGDNPVDTIGIGGIIWFVLYGIFLIALSTGLNKIKQNISPPSIITGLRGLSFLAGLAYCLLPGLAMVSLSNVGWNLLAAYFYLFGNIFLGLFMLGMLYLVMVKVR